MNLSDFDQIFELDDNQITNKDYFEQSDLLLTKECSQIDKFGILQSHSTTEVQTDDSNLNIEIDSPYNYYFSKEENQILSTEFAEVEQPSNEITLESENKSDKKPRKPRNKPMNLDLSRRTKTQMQQICQLIHKDQLRSEDFESYSSESKTKSQVGLQVTKNILKTVKVSICNYMNVIPFTRALIQQNGCLAKMVAKQTFYMEDFDLLYKKPELEDFFREYFRKKIIYRDFMVSRVSSANRSIYLYHLDVFEENFKKKEFIGISYTKREIQKRSKKIKKDAK